MNAPQSADSGMADVRARQTKSLLERSRDKKMISTTRTTTRSYRYYRGGAVTERANRQSSAPSSLRIFIPLPAAPMPLQRQRWRDGAARRISGKARGCSAP